MYYKIDGVITIDSTVNVKDFPVETQKEFKKELEEQFVAVFDSLTSKYNFGVESVHDVFVDYLDFEIDKDDDE